MTAQRTRPRRTARAQAAVRAAPGGCCAAAARLTVATLVLWVAVGALGCGDSGYDGAADPYGGSSPTGTFLSPSERDGPGLNGYEVLDEACEQTDDPSYLQRFETPMFRGVATSGGVAHLVDGSLLWSVGIVDATRPERLSMIRLAGHPLQIAASRDGLLFVAAGEAGLHVLKSLDATAMAAGRETGNASAVAPQLLSSLSLPGPALDVTLLEDRRYAVVAAGAAGLFVVDASNLAAPEVVAQVATPGFAFGVDVEGSFAYVAACSVLAVIDLFEPRAPQLVESYWVPHGHARGVDAVDKRVFVAGGEALLVYDAASPQQVRWTGYYAEPNVEGFYVNDVVVRKGIAYIAAGDESVRSVNATAMASAEGYLAQKVESAEPPPLDGPEVLPDNDLETLWVEQRDPIGIGLQGDLLFVLGNFRWLGERTLKIMRVDDTGRMIDVGAYVQPNDPIGVARTPATLVLHGAHGVETALPSDGAAPVHFDLGAPVHRTAATHAGLWLLTEDDRLFYWQDGQTDATELPNGGGFDAFDIALGDSSMYLSSRAQNSLIRLWNPGSMVVAEPVPLPESTFPGFAHLLVHSDYLYAYEWVTGVLHRIVRPDTQGVPVAPEPTAARIGQCEMYDIADYFSGRKDNQTRLVADADSIHVLCPHDDDGHSTVISVSLPGPGVGEPPFVEQSVLPAGRYVDLALHEGTFYALSFDNDRYLSRLTWLEGSAWGTVEFDGHANALLSTDAGLLVSDGDWGGRLYAPGGDGMLVPVGWRRWP
ncbi:MAG: hypothetical protein ABI333_20295 [bacterium]